jgi:hypothetical protein
VAISTRPKNQRLMSNLNIALEQEQNIISFFSLDESRREIFSLTMKDGKLIGSTEDPDALDQAAKLFFENLKIHGQSLLDRINAVEELEQRYPNDMEFGNNVRKFINENSPNRTR